MTTTETESVTLTTYKRADGDPIGDDYAWVTELDWFDEDDLYRPVEVVEEVWVRQSTRSFWKMPSQLFDCEVGDCDEDAVAWLQVCCRLHKPEGCCDPNDCGPCCESCPTCPTLARGQRPPEGDWIQVCEQHRGPYQP